MAMFGLQRRGFPFAVQDVGQQRGNSNTKERSGLSGGLSGCLASIASTEFVGGDWIKYLNGNKIRYHIRNNFKMFIPHKNKEIKIMQIKSSF